MGGYYEIDLLCIDKNTQSMENVDQIIAKLDKNKPDVADMLAMSNNLETLKNWCTNSEADDRKKEFYSFFENAIVGSFCRYRKSKTSTWSIMKNWLKVLGIAVLPVLSSQVIMWLDVEKQTIFGNSIPAAAAILVVFCSIQMYLEWAKNKNDKETWVRHSACYERLNLALSKFVLSKKEDGDFQNLMNDTFAILEQNLDQFALNLSSNGAAERPEISMTEE